MTRSMIVPAKRVAFAIVFIVSVFIASATRPLVLAAQVTQDSEIADAKALIGTGELATAKSLLEARLARLPAEVDSLFLLGMIALAQQDYAHAEALFRKILDSDPSLIRLRLELARTLFLAKKDEQADYHFRLAIAAHPPPAVVANIVHFREAIRARRAWRVNLNVGIAPDSNINSATAKDTVDLFGLPFRLDESAKARSGIGVVAGGDISVRLWRFSKVPVYLTAYGRMVRYDESAYNDVYVGVEAGPEFRLGGSRIRPAATAFERWYGGEELVTSLGGRLNYEEVIGGNWAIEGSLGTRHEDYARRADTDAWNLETSLSVNRAISPSTVGFAFTSLRRSIATEPAYSHWNGRLGAGVLREISWGLRPQLTLEAGRQVNDAPLSAFSAPRRDWSLQASASIYKRDWNIAGLAPSVRVSYIRTYSTMTLYDQGRLRAELGVTKAF